MSRVYDALKKLEAERAAPAPAAAPLDPLRVEQFMDLQRSLLLDAASGRTEDLPDRLVHRVATFVGASGAAIGVVRLGAYRLLATYGAGYEDRARHECASLDSSELAPVLVSGRPLVRQHRLDDARTMREIVLPIRGAAAGALHLAMPDGTALSDEKVGLARVLADLVGIALTTART
jgi:hypothetical protein